MHFFAEFVLIDLFNLVHRYLESARVESGVKVLCHRVRWGEGADVGKAYDDGELQLMPALAPGDQFISKTRS